MDVQARPTYRIETFGGLRVVGGAAPLTGAATQRKTLLLLAVLAASSAQGISRDRLLALFWPDSDADRARNALKQALHILRRDLHDPDLVSGGPTLRLNPESITSDVQEFEAALATGNTEAAAELYRGSFLDGLYLEGAPEFERWAERERGRLAHLHRSALEKLATSAREAGDPRRAVDWWRRLAAADPLSSRVAVELMAALAAAGDPESALQHARVHEALVLQELDAPPDAAVATMAERLREALRTGRAREAAAPPASTPPAADSPVDGAPRTGERTQLSEPSGVAEDRAVAPPPESRGWGRRRIAVAVGGLLALALIVLVAARFFRGADAVPVEASVAVLPFLDIGGDPDDAYFSDGLSEELITALSRVDGLRVAARTSSFALRDARLDMRTIGDTLGVSAVVEGSVRRQGDRLRVTAQLIDAASGYHLWSGAYDREVKDVFALQEEIARSIARVLRPTAGATDRSAPSQTASREAYDLYLRGTWFRNRLTPDAIAKAIVYYDQAIALDSGYALAYAGKATAMGPLFYFRMAPREPGLSEMRSAAQRALALDESVSEAHVAMGIIHFFYEWDWAASEREFRRATELNPGDPHAFYMLANWLRAMGRVDEAIAMRRRALELDPLNGRTAITLARDYMAAGQYDLAAEQFRRGIDIDSLNPLVLGLGPGLPSGMGEIHEARGMPDDAVEEYVRVAARRGATPADIDAMRASYRAGGLRGFWTQWLAFDERTSSGDPRALRMAATLVRVGDTERAIQWLGRAYRERDPGLVYLGVAPDWEPLRGDPRVMELLTRMRLPR